MSSNEYVAFLGDTRLASGSLPQVTVAARRALESFPDRALLVFDESGRQRDIDLREMPSAASDDAAEGSRRAPGRPRLGVVAREVTLLPRHWDWLGAQQGGASVTLRRLVDQARKADDQTRHRLAQEAADRFMMVMGGDRAGYEEATRALYRGDIEGVFAHIAAWPADIQAHVRHLLTTDGESE
ncbi:DUF2239 family protein [Uliginosibacterium sp. sgz301328]|uniref:DUF2239 family protein n=1 Tax=Uliginosibacterium sp. sgz301328 TaxID=3243764 RepID=UPI00359EF73C